MASYNTRDCRKFNVAQFNIVFNDNNIYNGEENNYIDVCTFWDSMLNHV